MKKILRASYIYAICGMLGGLFYREFTRMMDFEGATVLAVVHTHFLSMGMLFMLVILGLSKLFLLHENKWFKRFFIVYNIAFIDTVVLLLVRGVVEVQEKNITASTDGMIAGIAGLGHIGIAVSLVFLFIGLSQVVKDK